ncbi:MAG TPA: LuxR C-terminal-related transcriptional regulator [Burkholderiaceae bacterium]|nr:LuxR C-terminal-related transcriptional regulator [Burkholderiaceae bacterium]
MKSSNAIAHVRQLCTLGLGGTAVMPALLKAVRRLVPCDSAAFFWADDNGDWVNLYAERMLPPALMKRYFERYYEAGDRTFRQRMLDCTARRKSVAQDVDVDAASPYYREILKPLGASAVVQLLVQDNGRPLGQMSLYRSDRAAAFTGAEKAALEGIAHYVARCLDAAGGAERPKTVDDYRDSDEGALVVCTKAGETISGSQRAHALLAHASGEPINRQTLLDAVELKGRDLLRRLAGGLETRAPLYETSPALRVDNAWGRFRLNAYALGESDVGVLIQRQEHLLVRLVDAMRSLPLSAQQREVALHLAQGRTNGEIAERLGVALNTSTYHVKQLFQKLDAHDRTDAIARILGGHTERH